MIKGKNERSHQKLSPAVRGGWFGFKARVACRENSCFIWLGGEEMGFGREENGGLLMSVSIILRPTVLLCAPSNGAHACSNARSALTLL